MGACIGGVRRAAGRWLMCGDHPPSIRSLRTGGIAWTWTSTTRSVIGRVPSWSARQIRSGVIGSSSKKTPVASWIAAASAGAMARIPPSASPFEPDGPGPSAVLLEQAHDVGGSISDRGNSIVERAAVQQPAVFRVDQLLGRRQPEAHHQPSLVESRGALTVEDLAGIGRVDDPIDGEEAGLSIDPYLDARRDRLVKRGGSTERMLVHRRAPRTSLRRRCPAPELPARHRPAGSSPHRMPQAPHSPCGPWIGSRR